VYTPEGISWVEDNLFGDVVRRHHPQLSDAINTENAFAPWKAVGAGA
jgi:hypothetical protein